MQVDVTQVEALIADLHSVSRHTAGAAIKAGVQGILDDGKQKARDAYKGHPNKGFQYVGQQFTYDTKVHGASVEAEFGPEKPKGARANVAIFGTSRGGGGMPHPAEIIKEDDAEKIFEDVIRDIVGDLSS